LIAVIGLIAPLVMDACGVRSNRWMPAGTPALPNLETPGHLPPRHTKARLNVAGHMLC